MKPKKSCQQRQFLLIDPDLSQMGEPIHSYPGPTAELSLLNGEIMIVPCVEDGWKAGCISVKDLRIT